MPGNGRSVRPTFVFAENRDLVSSLSDALARRCLALDLQRQTMAGRRDGVQDKGESVSESARRQLPLNPAWVEWLMGWPIGHTDLDA